MLFAGIMATVMTVIYSQVQLTELTEEINQTSQALAEAESLEIQLNMAAAQKMTGARWRSTPPAWAWSAAGE